MHNTTIIIPKDNLHFDITIEFNNNGRTFNQIIKEHFLLYIKEIKKNEQKIYETTNK